VAADRNAAVTSRLFDSQRQNLPKLNRAWPANAERFFGSGSLSHWFRFRSVYRPQTDGRAVSMLFYNKMKKNIAKYGFTEEPIQLS
jgi:hypothetical protein